jgi:hypothetical protein
MKWLYRVSIKSVNSWDRNKRTLYVIARDKEDAQVIIENNLRENWVVDKVFLLGREMSSVLFEK